MPDEIKKAAEYLGLSEQVFFDQYLGVDWYVGYDNIFILAPAIESMETGSEYPANPIGKCIFFEDGLCKIHTVKPFECREYYHDDIPKTIRDRHRYVAREWKSHQDYITKLLGDEPVAQELSFLEIMI